MSQCLPISPFKVRDTLWLDSWNIKTTCPSKKLDHCFLGPFPIIEKVLSHMFQLGLSLTLSHIHSVFHVSLLQPTSSSEIPNRAIYLPPPVKLDNLDEWEVLGSLTAGLIIIARDQGCFTLLNSKGLTTSQMP